MGCFDVAEVCELVGTFIISKLSDVIDKKDVGLYRDDVLVFVNIYQGLKLKGKRKLL